MNGPHVLPTTIAPLIIGAGVQRGLVATGVAVGLYLSIAVMCLAGGLLMRRAGRRPEPEADRSATPPARRG